MLRRSETRRAVTVEDEDEEEEEEEEVEVDDEADLADKLLPRLYEPFIVVEGKTINKIHARIGKGMTSPVR